jgi:hypothetical protein
VEDWNFKELASLTCWSKECDLVDEIDLKELLERGK